MSHIAENLARVQDSIAAACRKAGRDPGEVELIAVSKTHPVELLIEAARAGQIRFGENRVQEFSAKSVALAAAGYAVERHAGAATAGPALQVHLIGHLQSNKAARAAELFSAVDTLDSLKLAERLNQAVLGAVPGAVLDAGIDRAPDFAPGAAPPLPVLIEIKLSHEPSKEGLAPESDELAALLERLPELTGLAPRGLMTVAPIDPDPEVARLCFRELRRLRDPLAQRHPRLALETLSMGMSGDFQAAIEEGSTQLRLGTAIFGARPKPV